ncbi:MAG: Na+/H+ antiporter subunit E [Cellulomonadaceae bacterium]
MSLHPRKRSWGAQWPTYLWLALVWMLLWGDFSWANLLGGLALGVLVSLFFPLPAMSFAMRVRPIALAVLLLRFIYDLVAATVQVSVQVLDPRAMPHGAVVGVRLRNPADLYLTITAELSTLLPGTLVVEAHRLTGMLYLHVLDIEGYGGADKVRDDVLELEARVLRALASNEDLETAGLARRRPRGGDPRPVTPPALRRTEDHR